MGDMKMRNIVPRAGIETTSLAFRASVLTITPHRLPDITTIPTLLVPEVSADYYTYFIAFYATKVHI